MRQRTGSSRFLILVAAAALVFWCFRGAGSLQALIDDTSTDRSPGAPGERIATITHGDAVDIEKHVYPGKVTLFDFYSDGCPPCVMLKPILHQVVEKEKGLSLKVIDLNRKGQQGIDWQSPVAQQYKPPGIPYLIIYDGTGLEVARGDDARQMLVDYINATSK